MAKYATRRKNGKTIPFGYEPSSHDPKLLVPINTQLDALHDAFLYLRTCSYRQVSIWLHKKTGRYISNVGLLKIHEAWKKARWQTYNNNKKIKAKIEREREIDRERRFTQAQAQEQRQKEFISRGES